MDTPANRRSTPLRVARARSGLTQERLAVKAGLTANTISIAERTGYITGATAEKLAAALGISAAELRPADEAQT